MVGAAGAATETLAGGRPQRTNPTSPLLATAFSRSVVSRRPVLATRINVAPPKENGRRVTTPRICPFCDLPVGGRKSVEHVFPQWLLRSLRGRLSVEATRFNPDGSSASVRSHEMDRLVLGGVCRPCNNGWMAKLEASTKRVLPALVTGTRSHRELSCNEKYVVARWATKTAITLNLATDFDCLFPHRVVLELAANPLSLPERIFVLTAQHLPSLAVSWLQTGGVDFFLPKEAGPPVEDRELLSIQGSRVGIQVGALCLVVVYWPHPQWPLAIWREMHEAAWPSADQFRVFEHRYDGENDPLAVNSRLFLYRALETVGAVCDGLPETRIAVRKNRLPHVSGPEPRGADAGLPVPSVVSPETDARIREWLAKHQQNPGRVT